MSEMLRKDIAPEDLNPLMYVKSFTQELIATVHSVEGSIIKLAFKRKSDVGAFIKAGQWSHAQCYIKSGIHEGAALQIVESFGFEAVRDIYYSVEVDADGLDLSKLKLPYMEYTHFITSTGERINGLLKVRIDYQADDQELVGSRLVPGDDILLEYDPLKIPVWVYNFGKFIFRCGFKSKNVGDKLPEGITAEFVQCTISNLECPSTSKYHGGGDEHPSDGIDKHLKIHNDREHWLYKKVNGEYVIDEPLRKQDYIDVGRSIDPVDIPAEILDDSVIEIYRRAKEFAEINNMPTYSPLGDEKVNGEYSAIEPSYPFGRPE